ARGESGRRRSACVPLPSLRVPVAPKHANAFQAVSEYFLAIALAQRQNGPTRLDPGNASTGHRCTMKKYFFDVVGQRRSEYDFRGRDFAEPQKAFQLAQLLALDLGVASEDEFSGGSINVRSADGQK